MRVSVQDTQTQGMVLSFALHIAVAVGTVISMPFLSKDLPEQAPIIVELVPISELTAGPPKPTPTPPPEQKPDPKPTPEPPKAAEQSQPQPDQMPPPPDATPPPPKQVAEVPKVPPPPPKPKPKPAPKKKDEWADLQSLVKDLEKKENKKQEQLAAVPSLDKAKVITPMVADKATMSERDAIAAHIEACWRIDPGKEGIDDLSAEVRVYINPDGSVQQAQVTDMGRYFADSAFRTFANSARNAVLSCGNIPISPERYEVFKEITFTFSPQGRIN